MTLEYTLQVNDHLQLYLYVAKKDKILRKAIVRDCLIYCILFLIIGSVFYYYHNRDGMILILALTAGFIIFRPGRLKAKYFDQYLKLATASYYKESQTTLQIDNEFIETKTSSSEIKIKPTAIEKFIETKQNVFIKLKSVYIIIPKSIPGNTVDISGELKKFAERFNTEFVSDINFKW